MRREELYLADILEAADAIEKFLNDVDKNAFIHNDLIRSAVLQKLTIIGEAASRLPKAFRDQHKDYRLGGYSCFPKPHCTCVLFYRLVDCLDNSSKRRS